MKADLGFFRNMTKEDYVAYSLEKLRELRDEYSEDIPAEILHSTSGNHKSKVRVGWWNKIIFRVDGLKNKGIELPEELATDAYGALSAYASNLEKNKRTTREDIDSGNRIIGRLIEYLENSIPIY